MQSDVQCLLLTATQNVSLVQPSCCSLFASCSELFTSDSFSHGMGAPMPIDYQRAKVFYFPMDRYATAKQQPDFAQFSCLSIYNTVVLLAQWLQTAKQSTFLMLTSMTDSTRCVLSKHCLTFCCIASHFIAEF